MTDPHPPVFADAVRDASAQRLSIAALFTAAATLKDLGHAALVAELYKTWIAFNGHDPLLHAAYFNYGTALTDIHDTVGAIVAFRECLRVQPDFHPARINLGRALEDAGQIGQAVVEWLQLSQRLPQVTGEVIAHKITALQQAGRVLESVFEDEAAEDTLRQCLDIDARQPEVIQQWIALRARQCRWPVLEESERLKRRDLLAEISPLSLANLCDDPMFQLAQARHYNRTGIGRPKGAPPTLRPRDSGAKLRIGYVSSDLREHAVGFAMTDVMETHDRDHFEISAYYCGIARRDPTQERIRAAVDHWVDINPMDDAEAAARIAADHIDILVDLNGYTKNARTKVFALRPAPIAVNWFGFPGTMGSPYHHYLIADPYVIPPGSERFYSETVLRLPCYQPNDRHRVVAARRPSRADEGLPDDAVVFCSFNGSQKLTAMAFQRWLIILSHVPDSVLWLLTGTRQSDERLRHLAAQQGVAPERLIFADKRANPDHLARYPLADLFLDNLPYGAHTTAADSLWMGVPILTLAGRSFASRVCASVLHAAGLGDLVCVTPEAYVRQAIALVQDRAALASLKARLTAGRDTCLLFDTPRLVRGLEELYVEMARANDAGQRPVPDLRHLDLYRDIGLDLDLESLELLADDEYEALYRRRMGELDQIEPVPADDRLWPGRVLSHEFRV